MCSEVTKVTTYHDFDILLARVKAPKFCISRFYATL